MRIEDIIYKELPTHPILKDYIKTYWFFECISDEPQSFEILPDGYFDMILSIRNNSIQQVRLVGIWSKKVTIHYSEKVQTVGVRFKPQALSSLLDIRIKELLDNSSVVDLMDWILNKGLLEDCVFGDYSLVKEYLESSLSIYA